MDSSKLALLQQLQQIAKPELSQSEYELFLKLKKDNPKRSYAELHEKICSFS